jgi:hypothetical protein
MEYQAYRDRVKGKNKSSLSEYTKTQIENNLKRFLEDSQYGFDVEVNGFVKRIAIMGQTGLSEVKEGVYVLSEKDVLKTGDSFKWNDDFWLIVKKSVRVLGESFYGEAYKCNIQLKWVDKDGVLRTENAYGKGRGIGSAITEGTKSQGPVVMRTSDVPLVVAAKRRLDFHKDMRFILNGFAYRIISIDNITVDGCSILSMIDDTIQDGDDLVNSVASYDKYYIVLDFLPQLNLRVGEPFEIKYKIMKNGVYYTDLGISIEADISAFNIDGNYLTPILIGSYNVIIRSLVNENVFESIAIEVSEEEEVDANIYIVGKTRLGWGETSSYYLSNGELALFTLSNTTKSRVTLTQDDTIATLSVGDKYSGIVSLSATHGENVYVKEIEITANGGA